MKTIPKHFKRLEKEFLRDTDFNFRIRLMSSQYKSKGGEKYNKTSILKFIDIGGVRTYKVTLDDITLDNQLHVSIVDNDGLDCVTFVIDTSNSEDEFSDVHTVVLHNMSFRENCAQACAIEGLVTPGGGSILLRFALNMIMGLKKNFNFDRIALKDNSFIPCINKQESVKLAQLRMITHGKPWYSEYGFKPYDTLNKRPSNELENAIDSNNDILDELKTNCIDVISIAKNAITKKKLNIVILDDIKRLMNRHPLMRNFITRISDELDKYCVVLNELLMKLYDPTSKLGLTNLHGVTFYLDI